MSLIKYALVREVKDPNRGTPEAAGIDFFIPEYNEKFLEDLQAKNPNTHDIDYKIVGGDLYMTIRPNGRILIPSGVKVDFEPGTALIAANKSGVSSKKGLVFTAQVVDSDYDGEMHIGVANISNESVTIKTGDKLIQFIHTPILLSILSKVTEDDITAAHKDSTRGAKGFGEGTGNN